MSSEQDIKTDVYHLPPDLLGQQTRTGSAWRGKYLAIAQITVRTNESEKHPLVEGQLFWRDDESGPTSRKYVDSPALTWESTDDELIAAAVQILEQAEGGQ